MYIYIYFDQGSLISGSECGVAKEPSLSLLLLER